MSHLRWLALLIVSLACDSADVAGVDAATDAGIEDLPDTLQPPDAGPPPSPLIVVTSSAESAAAGHAVLAEGGNA
ncbi:MAG: hypothetical protein AAGE52_35315, partial [Myxococcota bacterium]